MLATVSTFRQAIEQAGLAPPSSILPGKIARFPGAGKSNGNTSGWAWLSKDEQGGAVGDWSTGLRATWHAEHDHVMTASERAERALGFAKLRRIRQAEEAHQHAAAAQRARAVWSQAAPAPADHPYLTRKGVQSHGLRLDDAHRLIVPVMIDGTLASLQFIDSDSEKKKLFLSGGKKRSGSFALGDLTEATTILICEGYATGASLHEASGIPVVVAFDAGNLKPVAQALRAAYPGSTLCLCADDDVATEANPGITKATEAADAVAGLLIVPDFGADRPETVSDFNDLATLHGLDAVNVVIEGAIQHAVAPTLLPALPHDSWPDPLPLVVQVASEAYPLDALPDIIRAAVDEVRAFTKAPIPMVASSALAALSVAVQAHIDVKRAEKLSGPTSLFLLTIADSGERKSTCDGFFVKAIQEYEAEQVEAAKPEQQRHAAQFASWKAEQEGVLSAIKQAAKTGKPVDKLRGELLTLEGNKPKPPKVPKLLRGDDTPENLAWVLASEWPSIGVITAEAGCVLGSHGMGTDSVMRNLALLNTLWDGKEHRVGRRTSESFTVRGARLTMGLQVQEATLRSFFDRSKGLARGTGFLARFLVAWPESTQGSRPFTDPPDAWPSLAAFHRRIADMLNTPALTDDAGALSPNMLSLAPEAKTAWVEFHDAIESQLRTGGELYDVRDVASKTADNAARLAALFQAVCSNCSSSSGPVAVEYMESACRIAAWHLNESRRFFGELALPSELADPMRLDAWLLSHCQRNRVRTVPTRTVQQYGPGRLREKTVIEAATHELEILGRARWVQDGQSKIIQVNPALLPRGEA